MAAMTAPIGLVGGLPGGSTNTDRGSGDQIREIAASLPTPHA